MKTLKQFIKKHFRGFVYFYSFLKYRIFFSVGLSLLVGVLDGFGLAMFLPLLQMMDGDTKVTNTQKMGNLNFLLDGFKKIGIELNLTTVLLVMLIFFALKGVFKFIEGYYRLILQLIFIKKIRFSNINLLSGFKYSSFVTSDSGKIQNTFSGEVERVIQAYRNYFTAFQFAVLVFVYIVMAFMVNPQFALLVSLGGGLSNLVFKKLYFNTKANSGKLTNELHTFQGLLIQMVANFKYLKATGLIFKFGEKLKNSINDTQHWQRKIGLQANWLISVKEPIVMLVIVSVILIQVNLFHQPLGLIILSLLFFYRSLSFLMNLQNYWTAFLSVSGSLDNMDEFSKELSENQEKQGIEQFAKFQNSLKLEKLNFSYGDTSVLNNITITIHKNETIALVGESGSGKTTLINIIGGLLLAPDNTYFIDNIDITKMNRASFQQKIGYITQEPVVFNDSVFNNITFWDIPTPENLARFEQALKMASLYDFVMSLQNKEQEQLGNNGITVSGGQKQRISIARELYKEVDILLMDEATSALDSETEKSIQENIDQLRGRFTIIIIAHRLATIKNANKIFFLTKGSVENAGSFEALKAESESFNRMIKLQMV